MLINFPYTDLYALNLDWILQKIREFETNNTEIESLIESLGTVVNTVNGQSGNVIIDSSMIAGAKLGAVYVSPGTSWTAIVGNIETLYNSGIRLVLCGANNRDLYLLSYNGSTVDYSRYNPLGSASTFVESINGESGAVAITAQMINDTDINIFEWADPNETINDYSSANLLSLYNSGIRFILTQNTYGDYANLYTLYKSGNTVNYIEYAPTSAVAGVLSVNGMSGAVTITAGDVGAVPTTRTVNGHVLSGDIDITAGDVGAVPTTRTVNSKSLANNIILDSTDVGAVPTTRTVNSKSLANNITLNANDIISGIYQNNNSIENDLTEAKNDIATIFKTFTLDFDSITVPANGSANAIATNLTDIPNDYRIIGLLASTTGSPTIIIRAFNSETATYYLTNINQSAQTVTPTGIVLLAKKSTINQ